MLVTQAHSIECAQHQRSHTYALMDNEICILPGVQGLVDSKWVQRLLLFCTKAIHGRAAVHEQHVKLHQYICRWCGSSESSRLSSGTHERTVMHSSLVGRWVGLTHIAEALKAVFRQLLREQVAAQSQVR